MKIVTLVREKAPANFVPAAAVIRRGLTLFGMIGCKAFVGCLQYYSLKFNFLVKNAYNTLKLEFKRRY